MLTSSSPAYWIRSANEIGPPLENESISFLASTKRSNEVESPLFSGLPISGLIKGKRINGRIWLCNQI